MRAQVFGQVNIMQNQHGNEKNPQQTEEFQISICSHVLTAEGLRQLLHGWVKEYESHLNSDCHLRWIIMKNDSLISSFSLQMMDIFWKKVSKENSKNFLIFWFDIPVLYIVHQNFQL